MRSVVDSQKRHAHFNADHCIILGCGQENDRPYLTCYFHTKQWKEYIEGDMDAAYNDRHYWHFMDTYGIRYEVIRLSAADS